MNSQKKIALMDKYNKEGYTEGIDFLSYAKGFLERGCEVWQLDHHTINFKTKTGKVYPITRKGGQIIRSQTPLVKDIEKFDVLVNLGSSIGLNFAKKMERINVFKFNPPFAMCRSADKRTYIKNYPEFIPDTLITSSIEELEKALHERFNGIMIIKNPFGSCGKEVEKIESGQENYMEILKRFTRDGTYEIVAQRFMHFAYEGSKRVGVIGKIGEPESYRILAFYQRKPSKDNWKDNFYQGGVTMEIESLRPDEEDLCLKVARRSGLYGVGLDIMDDLDEEGRRVSRLVETNSVLVLQHKFVKKTLEIPNFILKELIENGRC